MGAPGGPANPVNPPGAPGATLAPGLGRGDVVIVPFPFSDLSATKQRPALVVAALPGIDVILCQITSQSASGRVTLAITATDFVVGTLARDSFVRPERIFTAATAITRRVGHLSDVKTQQAIAEMVRLLTT